MNENLLEKDYFKKSDNAETTTQTIRSNTRSLTAMTPKFNQEAEGNRSNSTNQPKPLTITSTATRKLTLVCCVCCIFMLIEFFGGLLSDSIAIMTDAAHLLSDLAGFLISIYALHISSRMPDANFTFGYHRAEIVGAIASVFIIWILTAVLLVESIARLFDSHHQVDGKIMLITSSIGLVFNGIMAYVLHSGGEGGHHHGHHHGDEHDQVHSLLRKEEHHHDHHSHQQDHDHEHDQYNHSHDHDNNEHHSHNHDLNQKCSLLHSKKSLLNNTNTNTNIIIMEEPYEENGSSNSFNKSKSSAQKKYVEMNQIIQPKEESKSSNNLQQFRNIQKEMHKSLEGSEIKTKKKESLTLNRNNRSDFDEIDNIDDQLKKRKSENITLNIRKHFYNLDFSSPHVSKQLTRDHSKLHKLDAFLGLREKEEDDNCSHNSNDPHSESFHTISFHDSSHGRTNPDQVGLSLASPSHLQSNSCQHKHNINVQAAFIHIIGDIIQSIGVIIAASLIYFFPSYQVIDPFTTILFSIIVITTTVPIIKQCIYAIMEGNTNEGDFTMIKNELINTPGVISVSCFHLYYLSLDKAILCAHIKVIQSISQSDLLKKIYEELSKYKIYHCTIEISNDDSISCNNMDFV